LQAVEIGGPQTSTDEKWNTARVTYWGVTDVVAGSGTQRGYYVNERADGSRDWGRSKPRLRPSGVRRPSKEPGKHQTVRECSPGIKARGTYKTRMISPTEVACTWQGRYELAASKPHNHVA